MAPLVIDTEYGSLRAEADTGWRNGQTSVEISNGGPDGPSTLYLSRARALRLRDWLNVALDDGKPDYSDPGYDI